MVDIYSKTVDEVLNTVQTSVEGLSQEEALQRSLKHRYNELKEISKKGAVQEFLSQFTDFLVIILV